MHPQPIHHTKAKPHWFVKTLYFHHVCENIVHYTNIPPKAFETYISFLAERFSFWTASEAFAAFKDGISSSGKLVLTFDDGYEDAYRNAIPILSNYGIRASFYLLPRFVGKSNTWNTERSYAANHMNWKQIVNLVNQGHDIGSHGMSHRSLIQLEETEIRDELSNSKTILERKLGVSIQGFSYPYGFVDARVGRLTQELYQFAFSSIKSQRDCWNNDRFSLQRKFLPIGASQQELCAVLGL